MRKSKLLIVAIVLMAVGFAVVTTNLVINGKAVIGNNVNDYEIRFTRAILDGIENNSLIIEDGKKISYETKKLMNIGDTSELVYEITNNSSQYDAEVSISCVATGTVTHTNLYTINTADTPDKIEAKRSETGSIEISLTNLATEEIKEAFVCTLNITAMERTTIGEKEDYKEELLKGADPKLNEGLIPITIANDGTVTYADVKEEWYKYENKNWANAVILVDNPSKTYSVGETIQERDIESYFVWIPRYRYKLFNSDLPDGVSEKLSESIAHTIEIEFESKDDIAQTGTQDGEWLTHPAFTNFDTNGIWVGKFETGYKGAQSTTAAEQNNANSSNIIVKPNVYSWRSNTVGNFFKAMYNYNRDLNSHMMKNTEWGAVAYLSHSIYGINDEVRINNNSNYLTGYAANAKDASSSATNNQAYNTSIGYLASTTGNITGIYDMSGGAAEYIAAYRDNTVGSSGLTVTEINETYKGYFDIYSSNSDRETYSNRILGDATGEIGPFYQDGNYRYNNWYFDYSRFVEATLPWFIRGGSHVNEISGGQFFFSRHTGEGVNNRSARLVLAF